MVNWSQHLKHEDPDFSGTFNQILKEMSDYFDVEIYAARLNFYPDGWYSRSCNSHCVCFILVHTSQQHCVDSLGVGGELFYPL